MIDSYDPNQKGEWGLEVVDLADVRELKYPSELYVQGRTTRIVASKLERADIIRIQNYDGDIELPVLRHVNYGYFPFSNERQLIELPLLESAKKLTIMLSFSPFALRLPNFKDGELILRAHFPAIDPKSTIDVPLLPKSQIKVEAREAADAVRALVVSYRGTDDPGARELRGSRRRGRLARWSAGTHPCPHCGEVPKSYRKLRDGGLVCMACGASSSA